MFVLEGQISKARQIRWPLASTRSWECRKGLWLNPPASQSARSLYFHWCDLIFFQVAIFDNWRILWWWPSRRNLQWSRLRELILMMVNDLHHFLLPLQRGMSRWLDLCVHFCWKVRWSRLKSFIARGYSWQATGPNRLLELVMGPKFMVVWSNGLENIDFLEVGGVRFFFFFGWKGQLPGETTF
jgi:hypothetical protein